MNKPPHGVSAHCRVVEVYDGDTITVEIVRRARVRLLDNWAPEVRTTDNAEKARGLAAKEFLRQLAEGKEGTIFIPTDEATTLDDVFTFGRVLGHVWVNGERKSLSERMVDEGFSTTDKPETDKPNTRAQ